MPTDAGSIVKATEEIAKTSPLLVVPLLVLFASLVMFLRHLTAKDKAHAEHVETVVRLMSSGSREEKEASPRQSAREGKR